MGNNWPLLPEIQRDTVLLGTPPVLAPPHKCESETRKPRWTESWVSRWTPTSPSTLMPVTCVEVSSSHLDKLEVIQKTFLRSRCATSEPRLGSSLGGCTWNSVPSSFMLAPSNPCSPHCPHSPLLPPPKGYPPGLVSPHPQRPAS